MDFKPFAYHSCAELQEDAGKLGLDLPFSENLRLLARKVPIGGYELPNSLVFHPMEGTDGRLDGSPDVLTVRRYERLARGGAGLIWFEAVAVVPEGRVSPRQLWLHRENWPEFRNLAERIFRLAHEASGSDFNPLLIMQLTHSGRFSKPDGHPAAVIAAHNPYLDPLIGLTADEPLIADGELERLEDQYVTAALLARQAGFHGVDIKACHRYLNSELLSAWTREGRYGGDYAGRTRFLLNIADKIKARLGQDFILTTRLNLYDGIPYPYGWGVARDELRCSLDEPQRLVRDLVNRGIGLINLTMGTPYYNPHVNRPYDKGPYTPPEHPLEGVARLIGGIGEIQKRNPGLAVVSTGFSWLRQFSPYLAAGVLEQGLATLIGYGREALAYPDFARDILVKGALAREKCCLACGKCTEIMRSGGAAGCVVRDAAVYRPIYRQYCQKSVPQEVGT